MKIKPTKSLWIYIGVLILSAYPAVLVNGVAGYIPFLTLLFCGVLSVVHLLLIYKKVSCQARLDDNLYYRGDDVPFTVKVENESILPVPLMNIQFYIGDSYSLDEHYYPLDVSLSAREMRTFNLEGSFPHLGVYNAGVSKIEVRDMLGLLSARGGATDWQELSVLPRLISAESYTMEFMQEEESSRAQVAVAAPGMDYVGVREYAMGDPIKMIQWKLSAHAEDLLTKVMENYTSTGISVVLNFTMENYGTEESLNLLDSVVETGFSLARLAMLNGNEYSIYMPMEEGEYREIIPVNFDDLREYVQYFHLKENNGSNSVNDVLRRQCAGTHAQTNVAVCSPLIDQELVDALQFLKQSRKSPSLYLLEPEEIPDQRRIEVRSLLSQLSGLQIPYFCGKNAGEVLK